MTESVTLYQLRCGAEDNGVPHRRLLGTASLRPGEPMDLEFREGSWVGILGQVDPIIRLRCPRHGVGVLPTAGLRPAKDGRASKPRVVLVPCDSKP